MTKRVLVTGANGFVGRRVCRQLIAEGWQVRGTVRSQEAARELPPCVEPTVTGNISKFENWPDALSQVDAVVHLVARTHVMHEAASDPLPLYRQVNVLGTERLLSGCKQSDVKRFLFVSSIKAVGETSNVSYTETSPCEPQDAYGTSKREAEELVRKATAEMNIESVILRPPLIYGPGVLGNFERILRAIDHGVPLPLGCVCNQRSLLYVDNFTAAIAVCLRHPEAANQVFHLADQIPVSTRQLTQELSRALNRPSRLLPVPVSLLRILGALFHKQDQISRLVDSLTVSTEKIEQKTGWHPRISFREGLAATVDHYRAA